MTTRIAPFAAAAVALVAIACSSADPTTQDPAAHVGGGDSGSSADDSGSQTLGDSGSQADSSTAHDGGNGPGDGGGPHDSATVPPEGGVGGFGATCDPQNNQCPTAYPICFAFNGRGTHCTQQCQSANDCPGGAGGLGCSGMGVCKVQ